MTDRVCEQENAHLIFKIAHRDERPESVVSQFGKLFRALLYTVGSELARAVCQSASKLADLRNSKFSGVSCSATIVGGRSDGFFATLLMSNARLSS
jgi:hypothetical protein